MGTRTRKDLNRVEVVSQLTINSVFTTARGRFFHVFSSSEVAVSVVLFCEENKKQRPVFYMSIMLLDAETRYSAIEKMVLALVNAKKKLRHYFETHLIIMIADFPIK